MIIFFAKYNRAHSCYALKSTTKILRILISEILGIKFSKTIFDATVFAIITAVGGGTIRDVILDVPVFWF